SMVENIDVEIFSQVLDPSRPLDPKLEGFLEAMLEIEGLNLPLPDLPGIPQIDAAPEMEKDQKKQALGEKNFRTLGASGPCADAVAGEFGSGFRICGLDYNDNVAEIVSNFARRV